MKEGFQPGRVSQALTLGLWLAVCEQFLWHMFCSSFEFSWHLLFITGVPRQLSGKESTCQCRRCGFNPWVGKILWRRKWQPILVFLPGKSHGQRSLEGFSPWGHKESDTTEWLSMQACGSQTVCRGTQGTAANSQGAADILDFLREPSVQMHAKC